eukprot:5198574-Prymnesium_polylepis.1
MKHHKGECAWRVCVLGDTVWNVTRYEPLSRDKRAWGAAPGGGGRWPRGWRERTGSVNPSGRYR